MELLTILFAVVPAVFSKKPNIVFILADDLGWNDVGFHGSGQIPTPNIDALAYSGLILNKYYVSAICTPSRSALMTGKHPIHTGMQHTVLYGAEPRGLPLNQKLLPQYLGDLGYANHIVGKWHLGCYKKKYTPTFRGFQSHTGYWTGHQDYNDHTAMEGGYWGLDMRRGMQPAWDLHGQYSTDIFTREAVSIINVHNTTQPLFLYIAHAAVHSGNPYNPLPAPDERVARFDYINNYHRRRFAGGVRGTGLLWSPLLERPGRVSNQLFHITDWLPTLLAASGGDLSQLSIDGMNLWPALRTGSTSPRTEILHNIDDEYGNSAITIGDWKLLQGTTYNGAWDDWYGPSGREDAYNIDVVIASRAGQAVASVGLVIIVQRARDIREKASVRCTPRNVTLPACKPLQAPCLFRIHEDPCEKNNLARVYPDMVATLQSQIKKWNATAVTPANLPWDPRGDPIFWDHTWNNFGDYSGATTIFG
ncbi:arylsulfatase I isoform X2 [Diprion similis]|uniref:arylsulfatase I isoform X2 n=1 Tax=Diprion similis TaxID=362088 RepID=UPI001EF84FA7|nr:arylsulfatase I isoform X2 [Diprion similis]